VIRWSLGRPITPEAWSQVEAVLTLGSARQPAEVPAPPASPGVRTLRVVNPYDGPYFVCEQGWWQARGAHRSQEWPGEDYLKIRQASGEPVRIQPFGWIDGQVRPGWGCQQLLWIAPLPQRGEWHGCRVRVLGVTPVIFAPRVEVNGPIAEARLGDDPWHYLDDACLFLPNRPGDYTLWWRYGRRALPHLCRTFATVTGTAIRQGELEVAAAHPPYVRAPEALLVERHEVPASTPGAHRSVRSLAVAAEAG
jgi:hypothetical protein